MQQNSFLLCVATESVIHIVHSDDLKGRVGHAPLLADPRPVNDH